MLNKLFSTLLAQAAGFMGGVLVGFLLKAEAYFPFVVLTLHTAISTAVAYFLKNTRPWIALNFLIPIALFASTYLTLPYTGLLILTLFIVLLYIPTFFSGVPFYPTSKEVYGQILDLIPIDKEITFLDLGSGFGSLLKFLADQRPKGKFIGVEISPLAFISSWFRLLTTYNAKARYQNLWTVDLSKYDVVYAFLAPGPMPKLWEKVRAEMKPGTFFITNTFDVGVEPSQKIQLPDERQSELLLFKIP